MHNIYRILEMKTNRETLKILKMAESEDTLWASFLDVDRVLSIDMFAKDGVHLNFAGTWRVGKEIVSVVR